MPAEVLGPPRKLHFTSSWKVVELVERGGGLTEQESRLMLNDAIAIGRGRVLGCRNSERLYAREKVSEYTGGMVAGPHWRLRL